jgi:lysophospholipase L1-like esterase
VRRLLARLALVFGTLLVLLVALEIGLRIASRFVERERGGARAATTVLCVGDSHTFGLHVLPPLSYPAQLQRFLDPSAQSIGVVNYGVPGRNSAALLRQLPAYLESIDPDLVLVLAGFNDSWNFDATTGGADSVAGAESWIASLRIARFFRLARLNLEGRAATSGPAVIEVDGKMMVEENGELRPAAAGGAAFGVVTGADLVARVTPNVERIVALVRAHGATPVLLTYATENQPGFLDLNQNARELGARLGVAVIDLAAALRPAIAERGYSALFFPDDHPNARGNELCGRVAADALRELGLVPEVAPSIRRDDATTPVLTLLSTAWPRVTLRVEGPPNRDFQVAFSPRREPPLVLHGVTLPIGDDPMLVASLENLNLRGRTGEDGRREFDADLTGLGATPGVTLYGVAAFFGISADPNAVPAVSSSIEVRR